MLRLENVLGVQTVTHNCRNMVSFILKFCKQNSLQYTITDNNIYINKGKLEPTEFYPCVVAHMDTVHKLESNLTVVRVNNNLIAINQDTMKQIGIGGDDKVGIYIALQLLLTQEKLKVAFFRDEESGCEGSYDADVNFFKDCGYVLEFDRKGNSDFITEAAMVELSSTEFLNKIPLNKFKYKQSSGMMTDVMALKELGINISMANISCGYYNAHTSNEYVNILDVEKALKFAESIILNLGLAQYAHEYNYAFDNYRTYNNYRKYNNYRTYNNYTYKNKYNGSFLSEEEARKKILELFPNNPHMNVSNDTYIDELLYDANVMSCVDFLEEYYPEEYYDNYDDFRMYEL